MKDPYIRSGLTRIRTHTTRKSSDNTPRHKLLMQLTALEIEMTRRATERAASMKRIDSIDERLSAIHHEQESIRNLLGLIESQETSPTETLNTNRTANSSHRDGQFGGVFEY